MESTYNNGKIRMIFDLLVKETTMYLKQNESLYDLGDGISVIQSDDFFKFGTDSVALAKFCRIKTGFKIADLGTGSAVIPLLLYQKNRSITVDAVEIHPQMADMARRSIDKNCLSSTINIINEDLKKSSLNKSVYDLVTCNPPYKPSGCGLINDNSNVVAARHETDCTLEDIVKVASGLLRFGGCLCMVHKPERLAQMMCLFSRYGVEPKRLQLINTPKNKTSLILLEGKKGGKPGVTVETVIK